MADFLPGIDIAISIERRTFLERMAAIGEQSGRFSAERHFDPFNDGDFDIVNLRYLGTSAHEQLGGQLISRGKRPGRIFVEMRAHCWSPDPPTRAVYCAAADALILPLLKIYNRTFGARYRFRVQKPGKPTVLTPPTRALLERFTLLANTASLHPLDWDRFYALVAESRQQLPEHELRGLLEEHGFSRANAERIADIYVHLWGFKTRRRT